MLHYYSIILVREKPEFRFSIPFRSSERVAVETFSKMAFCFNASQFDKIYLYSEDCRGRYNMLNLAYLRGSYEA